MVHVNRINIPYHEVSLAKLRCLDCNSHLAVVILVVLHLIQRCHYYEHIHTAVRTQQLFSAFSRYQGGAIQMIDQ
jgi:hypothetical protein